MTNEKEPNEQVTTDPAEELEPAVAQEEPEKSQGDKLQKLVDS